MQSRMCMLSSFSVLSLAAAMRMSITKEDDPTSIEYRGFRRAFSDIDDTMKCSNRARFHGIDTNCDYKGEIYPGVAQFQLEISLGPHENINEAGSQLEPPSPVPLSARPTEARLFLALSHDDKAYLHFEAIGQMNGFEGWALDVEGAQYGSVFSAFSMVRRDFEAVLPQLKYQGWLSYNSSLPTVFVADNGQGDVEAAELMHAHDIEADGRAPLLGAFIHHVQPVPLSSDSLETSWRSGEPGTIEVLAGENIHLFREYLHGACVAFRRGYISAAGYGRVAESVIRECSLQSSEPEFKLPDPRERKICRHFKPHFQIVDGQWTPRSANECDRPFADPVPGLMDGLHPNDIIAAGGQYITGFCADLSSSLLSGLAQAQALFEVHGGAEADVAELAEAGMPEMLYWALKEGVHCLSNCHAWPQDHSCDSDLYDFEDLLESPWVLGETGMRTWSGFCRRRSSHICRLNMKR